MRSTAASPQPRPCPLPGPDKARTDDTGTDNPADASPAEDELEWRALAGLPSLARQSHRSAQEAFKLARSYAADQMRIVQSGSERKDLLEAA